MIPIKYCSGCYNNYYNGGHSLDGICWSRKSGKIVWRIMIGMWESPPYLNKIKKRMASCWHGIGNQRNIAVKPEAIGIDGYWKR